MISSNPHIFILHTKRIHKGDNELHVAETNFRMYIQKTSKEEHVKLKLCKKLLSIIYLLTLKVWKNSVKRFGIGAFSDSCSSVTKLSKMPDYDQIFPEQ